MPESTRAPLAPAITVYGKPDCSQCHVTRHALDRAGLPYTYRDVTTDPDARATVAGLGYRALPVVTAGDMHWSGFSSERLRRLVEIHAATPDLTALDAAAEEYLAAEASS